MDEYKLNQYVYIASDPRSGSTLLSGVLGTHPRISTTSELSPVDDLTVDDYLCSCGNNYLDCTFWKEFERHMQKDFPSFSLRTSKCFFRPYSGFLPRLHVYPTPLRFSDYVQEFLLSWDRKNISRYRLNSKSALALANFATSFSGTDIFIDAMKDFGRLRKRYQHFGNELNFKVIHLVRDPRGVVNSRLKRRETYSAEAVRSFSRDWVRTQSNILRVVERTVGRSNSIRVRYEDLCERPHETLQSVADFLEVKNSFLSEGLDFKKMHILGNPMRLKGRMVLRQDRKWVSELDSSCETIVKGITAKTCDRIGLNIQW